MENQQQQPQTTSQCRGGCGFYGSPATEGLCSKCFKDSIKRKQDTSQTRIVSPNSSTVPSEASTSNSPVSAASVVAAAIAANLSESAIPSSGSIGTATADMDMASAIQLSTADVFPIMPSVDGGMGAVVMGSPNSALLQSMVHIDSSASLSSSCSTNSLEGEGTGNDGQSPNTPGAMKKVNRCNVCKKRVGLTGFVCRCEGLFCSEHRYDQAHGCTFDYKTMEREEIRKNNPVVVSDKGFRRI